MARYRNMDVVLKWRDTGLSGDRQAIANTRALQREAEWLRWLNRRGVGVRFHGFTEINGLPALVIERVVERNMILKTPHDSPEEIQAKIEEIQSRGFRVTEHTLQELNKVVDLLRDNRIMGYDLQFLLTESGRLILIDPEAFKLHDSAQYFTAEQLAEQMRASFSSVLRSQSPAHGN